MTLNAHQFVATYQRLGIDLNHLGYIHADRLGDVNTTFEGMEFSVLGINYGGDR